MTDCLLSLDQGTTSTRAILFDASGNALYTSQRTIDCFFPKAAWVEQNPEQIWQTAVAVINDAINAAYKNNWRIVSMGITNQRETVIVWHRETGEPVYPAIVWQDRRTNNYCKTLKAKGYETIIRETTGLLLDPYFSASKIAWVLDHVEHARDHAEAGVLCYGTIETFLLYRLTGGKQYLTDVTNASRTSLFNIHEQCWDQTLLNVFNIPRQGLAEIVPNHGNFGCTAAKNITASIAIHAMIGDQQSALVGQTCFHPGQLKSTYGTGAFLLANTGQKALVSKARLLTTIAYQIDQQVCYGLEGAIFNAGTTISWMRDNLGLFKDVAELDQLLQNSQDTNGVYMVNSFTGLGAPYWRADVKGAILGLTRDSNKSHLVCAGLESIGYQTEDLIMAMAEDGITIEQLNVDGGMSNSNWFCQFLADICNINVIRPMQTETTALGAAYLAGLQSGVYKNIEMLTSKGQIDKIFKTKMSASVRAKKKTGWQCAVKGVIHAH